MQKIVPVTKANQDISYDSYSPSWGLDLEVKWSIQED